MLAAIGGGARAWAARNDPWTDVYGVARSLLALSTALTLVFSGTSALFRPGEGVPDVPQCGGARQIGLFCSMPSGHLEVARWMAVAVLVLVASGWRPRWTGIPHWFIAFSFQANALVLDGGDSVVEVLTLLLIPMTLTDGRRWHWQAPSKLPSTGAEEVRRVVALVALTAIRLQVAGIYFHAAIGKMGAENWVNGTVLYYVFTHPLFGAAPWLKALLLPLLRNGVAVTLMTYGVLVLEYLLSAGIVMEKRYWARLLVAGLALHLGIIVIHGLISFGLAMFAALVLYLGLSNESFGFIASLSTASRR